MYGSSEFRSFSRLVACLLAVLVAAGATGPSASASTRLPAPSPGIAPIVVTIDKPLDRQSYPSNGFIPVSAKVVSATAIASVELWVDGALADQKPPLGSQNRYSAYFSWQPARKGGHTLVVRAVDERGDFADSTAVRITATDPVDARVLIKAAEGQEAAVFAPVSAGPASFTSAQPGPAGATASSAGKRAAPAAVKPLSNLTLVDGKLLASSAIERVYYYVSLSSGQWRRVPEDPNAFVSPLSPDDLKAWGKADSSGVSGRRVFEVAATLGDLRAAAQGETQLSVEIWGWVAGRLEYLGDFQQDFRAELLADPARLLSAGTQLWICGSGISCIANEPGMGWVNWEVTIDASSTDQKHKFRLETAASGWDGTFVWQVSTLPFSGGFDPTPPGLVANGADKGATFTVDFLHLQGPSSAAEASMGPTVAASAQTILAEPGQDTPLSSVFNAGLLHTALAEMSPVGSAAAKVPAITYYVRVTPMAGSQPVAQPSNTISVRRGPKSDDGGVQWIDPNEKLPGIFDIEVLEFNTFNLGSSGCAKIIRNDSSGSNNYQVGQVYCPSPFKGIGEKAWYEQFLDALSSGMSLAAKAYELAKDAFTVEVALATPGCYANPWCMSVLGSGLDMTMASAGLPTSLPSFAELGPEARSFLGYYIHQQVGVECGPGSACGLMIQTVLEEKKQAALAGGSNEACLSKEMANAMGFEPMCLPAGVVGVPVEGSMPKPASIRAKITRKANGPEVGDELYQRYRLDVSAGAINNNYPAGKPISVPVNYPRDGSTYALMCGMAPDEVQLTLNSPLGGTLFVQPTPDQAAETTSSALKTTEAGSPGMSPAQASNAQATGAAMADPSGSGETGLPALPAAIPRLKPGESAELRLDLEPAQPFWIEGHQKAIQNAGGAVCFDDWYRLYQGSRLTASAAVSCSAQNQYMTCKLDPTASSELTYDIPW